MMSISEVIACLVFGSSIILSYAHFYYLIKRNFETLVGAKKRIAELDVRIQRIERYLGNKYKFWKDTDPPDTDY